MCDEKYNILEFLSCVSVCQRSAVLERFDMANWRITNAHIDDLIESGCISSRKSPGAPDPFEKVSITSKGLDALSSEREIREDKKHKHEQEIETVLYRNQQRMNTVKHEKAQMRISKLTLLVAFADFFFNHISPMLKMLFSHLFKS